MQTATATPAPAKSLVSKLAEVMAAVERVPKRGRNEFHRYDYATEADIVATVRKELSDRQVMLIPSVTGEVRHTVGEKGSVLTVLEMEMEFLDGESGQSITKKWRGYGTDKEDKGGYKAMTGAAKYFCLKTFLMPTGDDPEADDDKTTGKAAPRTNGYANGNGHAAAPARPPAAPPRETVNTATGEISDAGLLTVREASRKEGNTNGRKWTKWTVHFSDGSKATTLDRKMGEAAEAAVMSKATVRPLTKEGKFGSELEALDVVHEPAIGAPAAASLYDEPAGFMDGPDDEPPF